jgi:hypothetical protein
MDETVAERAPGRQQVRGGESHGAGESDEDRCVGSPSAVSKDEDDRDHCQDALHHPGDEHCRGNDIQPSA